MNYITAQFKKSLSKQKGFTLVELMVVIAIIAILAVVGAVVYSTVQSKARDSKRQADIGAIADALESKKDPSAAAYSSVTATDFSNGLPTDSVSPQQYCIAVGTSKTTTIGGPSAWTTPTSSAPCALTSTGVTSWAAFSGTLAANTQVWKVCALLENGTGTAQIFCKSNSQ